MAIRIHVFDIDEGLHFTLAVSLPADIGQRGEHAPFDGDDLLDERIFLLLPTIFTPQFGKNWAWVNTLPLNLSRFADPHILRPADFTIVIPGEGQWTNGVDETVDSVPNGRDRFDVQST